MTRRLVIFDMDGTLIDSQRAIIAAMRDAYAAFDAPAPADEAVRRIIGLSLPQAFARLTPGAAGADIARLADLYKQAFLARRARAADHDGAEEAPLYPGARAALAALAPRHALSVATGKARRGLDHAVRAHGFEGLFTHPQTADDAPSKPHPAMIEQCAAAHGLAPAAAVMVGDTSFDMQMARAAGARAIGVAWGYHPVPDLTAAGADIVIDAFADLPQAVARMTEAA